MRPLFGKSDHESVNHNFQELILVLYQISGFDVNWNYISNMELGFEYGTEYGTGGTLIQFMHIFKQMMKINNAMAYYIINTVPL